MNEMNKTHEEIAAAVLAECERVCKDGAQPKFYWGGVWMRDGMPMYSIKIQSALNMSGYVKDLPETTVRILHCLLGLEARDAVEWEQAKARPLLEVVARVLTLDDEDVESLKYFADGVLSLYDPEQEIELQNCLESSEDTEVWLHYRKQISDLEARDAVEQEREEMMKTVDALNSMVSVNPQEFANLEMELLAERARSAKLVEALEHISTASRYNAHDDMSHLIDLQSTANEALKTYKEGATT
jgi:hypothetical protein